MNPWAYPHTNVAARSNLSPIFKTGFLIQLSTRRPVNLCLIFHRDGIGGATDGTFFTVSVKIFNPDIHRFIDHKRQIGSYRSQPDPRPEFLGDQISETSHFAQAGIDGQRNQKKIIVTEVVGSGGFSWGLSINPGFPTGPPSFLRAVSYSSYSACWA